MVIYIILLLMALGALFIRDNFRYKQTIVILPIFAILFILEMFRSLNVGIDYKMYYNLFLTGCYNNPFIEPLYKFINNFALSFNNFYLLLFFVLFITFLGIFLLNRQFGFNKITVLSIFILTGIYFQSFDILRQYIAIGIICIGLFFFFKTYRCENNIIKYIIFIIFIYIAFNFHKTAIYAIVFLLLPKIHFKQNFVLFSGIMSICLSLSNHVKQLVDNIITYLTPYYSAKYGESFSKNMSTSSNQTIGSIFIRIIPIIVQFILLYYFIKNNYRIKNYKMNFICSGYLLYLILSIFISFWGNGLRRFQIYFLIFPMFYSCMYVDSSYLNSKKLNINSNPFKEYSFIEKFCLILIWVLTYIAKLIIDSEEIVPYKFI